PTRWATAGWAVLENLHEFTPSLLIPIIWLTISMFEKTPRLRLAWPLPAASATVTAIIINTTISVFLGGVFVLLAVEQLFARQHRNAIASMAMATIAGLTLLAILSVNQVATSLTDKQAILAIWPITTVSLLHQCAALQPV